MHYRSSLSYRSQLGYGYHRTRPVLAPLPPWVVAALLWVTVSVGLCFGYYGNKQMVLGPNSSRLLQVSSLFVRQVQMWNSAGGGLMLYGFPGGKAPVPSSSSNWTLSRLLSVGAYGRRGFSLWLNRGSVLKIRWGIVGDVGLSTKNVNAILFKGEKNLELLQEFPASSGFDGGVSVEYRIEEDDGYYVGAANQNPHAVPVSVAVEVSAKVYDATAAAFFCSMGGGDRCKMDLFFPKTQYAVLVTPESDDSWYVEMSFVARVMSYLGIVGLFAAFLCIFLRCANACGEERSAAAAQVTTETAPPGAAETDPLMGNGAMTKGTLFWYGAMEEDPETAGSRGSAEDLYEGKLCVICYEELRSCFFTPCGHCATCLDCAKRIMEEESKVCPICRRLIHKVRRLQTHLDHLEKAQSYNIPLESGEDADMTHHALITAQEAS